LHQLERTLGIRMERMQADDAPYEKPRTRVHIDPAEASARGRMARLPGEVLQVQLGS
jgi:hypothetical protein